MKEIIFSPIGLIKTPYIENAPYQAVEEAEGDFKVVLDSEYSDGLKRLDEFNYCYVIFYLDRLNKKPSMIVKPPWAGGIEAGMFATRTPVRPNPVGLSIVSIKKIENNIIHIGGIEVYNDTPLLDIKPYIPGLDSKSDANSGWLEQFENSDHMIKHLRNIPHGDN